MFYIGDEIKEGDIRLVGGSYLWKGRVEIFISDVWGTVSDDNYWANNAKVICRQLGYNTYSKVYYYILSLTFGACDIQNLKKQKLIVVFAFYVVLQEAWRIIQLTGLFWYFQMLDMIAVLG